MKPLISVFFSCLVGFATAFGQEAERCATRHTEPVLPKEVESPGVSTRSVVTIPVVVHVVWNTAAENISNEQILSQIDVLNEDYSAQNVEIPNVPAVFQPLIADVEFQFCLAQKDPDGNPTTGITRTFTSNSIGIGGTVNIHHSSMGGHDAWNPDKYLNIWVAKFAGGLGGVASFPGEGPADEQGVEINFLQFGNFGTVAPPYHLGRTCTHEIGHYFNLEHLWGPNFNSCCDEDDGVADTPNSCENYLSQCPTHPTFSCTQPDMFMNFMNYTDDACMAMFSKGQKERMLVALNTFRPGLLDSDACSSVGVGEQVASSELVIFQNPADEMLGFEIKTDEIGDWQVTLTSAIGQKVFEKNIPSNHIWQEGCDFLPSGIYFLAVKQGDAVLVKRVVIL
ncbi:MAG: T9SS type A sorting domain-containing protein [Bacteroidetes bacterium]|nr:T9SS type A sorting domain-containing protein [Bacteroidota bacterium]